MSNSTTGPGDKPGPADDAGLAGHLEKGVARAGQVEAAGAEDDRTGDGGERTIPVPASPVLRRPGLGTSPLSWWRMHTAEAFCAADFRLIRAALEEIATLVERPDVARALRGDGDAAIAVAFALMPIRMVSLSADIAMTAVLACALAGDPGCALVLAHVTDRAGLDPRRAEALCRSWFDAHLRRARMRGGVTAADEALVTALCMADATSGA